MVKDGGGSIMLVGKLFQQGDRVAGQNWRVAKKQLKKLKSWKKTCWRLAERPKAWSQKWAGLDHSLFICKNFQISYENK